MERHEPKINVYTLDNVSIAVYNPPSIAQSTGVMFYNTGEETLHLSFGGGRTGFSTDIPVKAGDKLMCNPIGIVYGSSAKGTKLLVATGIEITPGGLSSDGLSSAKAIAQIIAEGSTQKELLAELLLQLKLIQKTLNEAFDLGFDESDLR